MTNTVPKMEVFIQKESSRPAFKKTVFPKNQQAMRNLSHTTVGNCEKLRLYLNQLSDGTDRHRIPPQDEDHSGNDPHLVRGFPHLSSGIFPERFRIVSVPVGSREIRLL